MKIIGLNQQQNKQSFGNYKVEIEHGALNSLMSKLKGSLDEKTKATIDIIDFTKSYKIKHQNEGTVKISNFKVDNYSTSGTPIFSFDSEIDGINTNKKVGGINHSLITHSSQILEYLKSGLNFLSINLAGK